MEEAINVQNLSKVFQLRESGRGLLGSIRSVLRPTYREVRAVDSISFSVDQGQKVAFIGPNGAGKSTTIKMLCGILRASSGHINIAGIDPTRARAKLPYRIGTVFGQRSQLWYHIPPRDSFALLGELYNVPRAIAATRTADLVRAFDAERLLDVPVRKLSLGERMRCEIIASLIHAPKVLLLDEPTIGLDVIAKQQIRSVINDLNAHEGVTILLTSHDAGDIEALAERTVVINHGRIVFDGATAQFRQRYVTTKRIELLFDGSHTPKVPEGARVVTTQPSRLVLEVDAGGESIAQVATAALAQEGIVDVNIAEPDLEEIIGRIYQDTTRSEGAV